MRSGELIPPKNDKAGQPRSAKSRNRRCAVFDCGATQQRSLSPATTGIAWRTSPIGCLARVSSGHAATRMENRTKFCQCFSSGVCSWSLVDLESELPCFDSTAVSNFVQLYIKRNNTVILQTSRCLRFERLLVASIRKRIRVFTTHLILSCDVLRRHSHRDVRLRQTERRHLGGIRSPQRRSAEVLAEREPTGQGAARRGS